MELCGCVVRIQGVGCGVQCVGCSVLGVGLQSVVCGVWGVCTCATRVLNLHRLRVDAIRTRKGPAACEKQPAERKPAGFTDLKPHSRHVFPPMKAL